MHEQTNRQRGSQSAMLVEHGASANSRAGEYWNRSVDPMNRGRMAKAGSAASEDMALAYAAFLSPETARAIAWMGNLVDRDVLVLGCGLGQGAVHLAQRGARVVATDVSDRRCAAARAWAAEQSMNGSVVFRGMPAEALTVDDDSFDFVFGRDVLMYTDRARVAAECARVLRPGGKVVFVASLAGGRAMRAMRRLVNPSAWGAFTRYLTYDELGRLGGGLRRERQEACHLFGMAAFAVLFKLGRLGAFRFLLRGTLPIDDYLLRRYPVLRHRAWRGMVCYAVATGTGNE